MARSFIDNEMIEWEMKPFAKMFITTIIVSANEGVSAFLKHFTIAEFNMSLFKSEYYSNEPSLPLAHQLDQLHFSHCPH